MSILHDAQYSVSDISFKDRTNHAHSDHLKISLTFALQSIFEDTAKVLLILQSEIVEEFLSFPQKSLTEFSMEGLAGLWQLQNKSPEP
jgi:hypothetical protein